MKPSFPNYLERGRQGPAALWWALRVLTLACLAGLLAFALREPEQGLRVFWTVVVPMLPLVFVLAPGLWRQVCPMAFANQLPRTLGLSLARRLPLASKNASYLIAATLFFTLVSLRPLSFSVHAGWLVALICLVLILAFVGGLVFAGRSGWCGTFCPLAPLQRSYGMAPIVLVNNGYCDTCLGCQKNCYDFNPRAAFVADYHDDDPAHIAPRRFFNGALPGFIIGFFLYGRWPLIDTIPLYFLTLFSGMALSLGLYVMVQTYTRLAEVHISAAFAQVALVIFYLFAAEPLVQTLSLYAPWLAGLPLLDEALCALVALVALVAFLRHMRANNLFLAEEADQQAPPLRVDLDKIPPAARQGPEILELASGQTLSSDPAKSLLESFEDGGVKLDFGCRMGLCGADPVVIVEGQDNLSEPSAEERASLQRLGLEGKARLACVCKVKTGRVVVDLSADPTARVARQDPVPAEDRALNTDIRSVVIVGNGAAGTTMATELRRLSPSVRIDVVTQETHAFYNRMGLARLVHQPIGVEELYLLKAKGFVDADIRLHRNTAAHAIDRGRQRLQLSTGEALSYDRLILATGASAVVPDVPGVDLPGVFVMRTAADAEAIRSYAQSLDFQSRQALVVGGGVLGVETADALSRLSLKTTILERSDRLMQRELDARGSEILQTFLTRTGIRVRTDSRLQSIRGRERMQAVTLDTGETLSADLLVFCVGVKPNTELAEKAGLTVNRGIVVDDVLRTSDPLIFAIGDAAETTPRAPALWPISMQQALTAAHHLMASGASHPTSPVFLKLKHNGICVFRYGVMALDTGGVEIVSAPEETRTHRRLVLDPDNRLKGAIIVGPPGAERFILPYLGDEPVPADVVESWQAEANPSGALGPTP